MAYEMSAKFGRLVTKQYEVETSDKQVMKKYLSYYL